MGLGIVALQILTGLAMSGELPILSCGLAVQQ